MQLLDKNSELSLRRQCEILALNRSTYYYKAKSETPFDISVKDAIRFLHGKYPFYGYRKATKILQSMGFKVNHKKVKRLRKELGIIAIYPKPNLSKASKEHKKYPYLLKDVEIARVNQVWSVDITYVRIKDKGWIYVVAIIDWFSRYIVAYEVSTSQDLDFCLLALEAALMDATPEIFNSDQGSQFTSNEHLSRLEKRKIKISMTSTGRCLDNVIVERFWRSLKYESVYLTEYSCVKQAKKEIAAYIEFYNHERIHQSLNYYTPYEIYFRKRAI